MPTEWNDPELQAAQERGNAMFPTPEPEFRRDRHGFPIGECHRCGGTGNYSYCPQYGTTCFGCSGSGLTYLVPKHHAAWRDEVRKAVRVVAQDLRHGDRVRPWGSNDPITGRRYTAAERGPYREVIAIEVDHEHVTGTSTVGGVETDRSWRTTITWDDGEVQAMNGYTLFARQGVTVDPAPFIARAERGARYLRDRRNSGR